MSIRRLNFWAAGFAFSLMGCSQLSNTFSSAVSSLSVPTRALHVVAQYPLQSQGVYFSVREIYEMSNVFLIAGSRWQSSGQYGYITIPKSSVETFPPVIQPMTPLAGYSGQGCNSGDQLFDLNWSGLPQGLLSPAVDGTMQLNLQTSVLPNQTTGCVWSGNYIYVAGNDTASRIWVIDTRITPLSNASVIGHVDIPNSSGQLISLKVQNGQLFAKSKYQNQIFVYSLADPTSPSYQTVINTQSQGSFDIAIMNDLWVDAGYIVSVDCYGQTVQIFTAAAPYNPVRELFLTTRPTTVYRAGNILFVGSTSSQFGGDGLGYLDAFDITTGNHLATVQLGMHMPTSLWSNGLVVLAGGIWPAVPTEPGFEVYEFR